MEYIKFNTIDWTDKDKFSPEKWTWLELLIDFVIPIGDHWYNSNLYRYLELKKGDIFAVSFGEYQDTDNHIKECLWMIYNGKLMACPYLSTNIILTNETKQGGKVFTDVTLNIKRLQKLNQILQ